MAQSAKYPTRLVQEAGRRGRIICLSTYKEGPLGGETFWHFRWEGLEKLAKGRPGGASGRCLRDLSGVARRGQCELIRPNHHPPI